MLENRPDNRNNLKNYYKHIKKCVICKQEYGLDGGEVEKNICPPCIRRTTNAD